MKGLVYLYPMLVSYYNDVHPVSWSAFNAGDDGRRDEAFSPLFMKELANP